MKVKLGSVWDETLEAARGRADILAPIAGATLFLPSVVQTALGVWFAPPGSTGGRMMAAALLSLVLALVMIWGGLAIMAVASHPSTTRADAGRRATARIWPVIGVSIVLALIAVLLFLPVAIAAAGAMKVAAMAGSVGTAVDMNALGAGTKTFIGLYFLALLAFFIVAGARLLLINPVLLNERVGVRAIRRSFDLTRGLTWKLIGLLVLFGVVVMIAGAAAQLVTGVVFRIVAGPAVATFAAGVASAAVTALFSVLAYVFLARLYARLSGHDAAAAEGLARDAAPTY